MAMEVEFWRGPLDGVVQAIPDDANVWIVKSPKTRLNTRPEAPDAPPPTAEIDYYEYAYVATDRFGKASKCRIFDYIGERARQ